jgi:hypothetical protein
MVCSGSNPESITLMNCSFFLSDEVCICGDVLDLSLVLPFTDFLPETVPVDVSFHGEVLVLGMRIPPAYTSHAVLMVITGSTCPFCDAVGIWIQRIQRWSIFFERPFFDNFELRFTIHLCCSQLGGVKSMLIAVLWTETFCEPSVVFDR